MSITFETKVWENDWEIMLKTNRIQAMIDRCGYSFDEKILYINNVLDWNAVESAAQALINKGTITKYVKVADHVDAALEHFSLSAEKLGKGYYYSIAELVSIYLTTTDYLLHFSSDAIVAPETPKNWLEIGIDTLEQHPQIKVFNLTWDRKYRDVLRDLKFEDAQNCYGHGFSDQMYLIKTEDFKRPIYEFHHAASEIYPAYGGELFEKKVDSWMRCNEYLRATFKHGSYLHQNHPKNAFKKRMKVLLGLI